MAITISRKTNNEILSSYFDIKSPSTIKKELAISRAQFSSGEYKEASIVLKELRAKYGV